MRTMQKALGHVILLAYVAVILYPFVFVLSSSFKKNNQAIALDPWGLPKQWSVHNYVEAWVNAKISTYFLNSLYVGVVAAVAAILIAAAASFALTRMRFRAANKWTFQFVLLGLLIPGNALLIPVYSLLNKTHLYNTHWALILPYVAFALPLTIVILAAFMRSLPGEVEEAAVMDGLSSAGLFVKIILPITMPALVTVFIINFLGNWNEFLLANFFLASDKLKTLPVGMVGFRDTYNTNYAQLSAGIVYSVLPVLVMYSILQEKIIAGVTAGSVKG